MAISYLIIGDIIYKRSFDATFFKFLSKEETNKAMEQVHDNLSGGHFNGEAIFHKLLRLGYY